MVSSRIPTDTARKWLETTPLIVFIIRGKLYGLFDNEFLFIIGVTLFEIGAAVSDAAPNMNTLIVGRAIGGVGGNGLYLGAMDLVCAFTSLQERPIYLSFFGITWGIGTLQARMPIPLR